MARRISRDYECDTCGRYETRLVSTDVDHWAVIPHDGCEGGMLHHKPYINVSTSKTSASIPDAVAKGRFNEAREKRKFQQAAWDADGTGNVREAREVRKEAKKAGYDV